MNNYLEHYMIELKTLAPVFIGSGEVIGKKEYLYDYFNKKVYVFRRQDLYRYIVEKKLSVQYERYLLQENMDLYAWMKKQGLRRKDYEKQAFYQLDCSDAEFNKRTKEIHLFVKDAYGNPYIPGSSLKGAIRTALLGWKTIKNKQVQPIAKEIYAKSKVKNKSQLEENLDPRISQLEADIFHTVKRKNINKENAICDELAGLRISDSRPLLVKNLTLCQKIDQNIEKKQKKMPLLRECLKPNTKVAFELTIDTSICQYKVEDILNAIDAVFEREQVHYRRLGYSLEETDHTLLLGGGSGFVSKTIEYDMFTERNAVEVISNIMMVTHQKHGHDEDRSRMVSPHILKMTKYAGRDYHMGLCDINIKKADF